MKLTEDIKRMLNALAYANAGDNLTLPEKTRVLLGCRTSDAQVEAPAVPVAPSPQVGLYLGGELPGDLMQYVMQTCARLKHGLTVFTFQSEDDARATLAPYQGALAEHGIALQLVTLAGEPPAPLAQALRRRPEVVFLVCNESGYLGRGLLTGTVRRDALPVPVVMVAGNETAQRVYAAATARVA